ncbi:MAG: hypothetical protein IIC78_09230 [Chloroflexi bacterium]|nr:hypothetical protein [Chloroflexota bacterium]
MFFRKAMFVGLTCSAGSRPMHYAILDKKLNIQALDAGDLENVLAVIGGLRAPVVAVGAPQRPSQGVMARPAIRRRYNLNPESTNWTQWRLGEYELRRRNIRIPRTPAEIDKAPRWMQNGFELYVRLKKIGLRPLVPDEHVEPLTFLEVQSHACYTVLLERRPYLKRTLEGRLQRQLVLNLEGLNLRNPMEILGGITRQHLLQSSLPMEDLYNVEELDCLINAYTAYLVSISPERIHHVGDAKEGLISVPTMQLKEFYV